MKIIPTYFPEEGPSSERKVFKLLSELEMLGEWVAFHSQNISEYHREKQWCELDFIIIGPKGVLALEVKGGRVACKDGIWSGKDRHGREHLKKESPFDQANKGRFALEAAIKENIDWQDVRGTLFGWGVIFPDVNFDVRTCEASPELIAGRDIISNKKRFGNYIKDLYDFWQNQVQFTVRETTANQINKISGFLRPNLDLAPRMSSLALEAEKDFVRLTEDQYLFLDCTEDSERILCRGGAGTGKTFVAAECARREASSGHSILFVVESPLFAQYLRTQIQHPLIHIYDFATLALAEIKEIFELLIIDEGQDLMNCVALDLFDSLLEGGLESGRWRWFMDPNNQAGILGRFDQEAYEILALYTHTPLLLKRNVRNTKPIATQTQLITGADIGVAENIGGGSAPQICMVNSREDEAAKLQLALQTLLNKETVLPKDIAILSFQPYEKSCIQLLSSKLSQHIVHLTSDSFNAVIDQQKVLFSSIHNFKGLEKKFIFIVDLDNADPLGKDIAKLYVALTRANFGLWLALPNSKKVSFEEVKLRNTTNLLASLS